MMDEEMWGAYLALLRDLAQTLGDLTQVEHEKAAAVRKDDLAELNELLKREQALSLSLRSLDGKREKMMGSLDLEGSSLKGLSVRCPARLREEARSVEEELRRQYQLYRGAADMARTTLECNLHEIEKLLAEQAGGSAGPGLPGSLQPELPRAMKTDFRA